MRRLYPAKTESIPAALEVLRNGGHVIFPTDTVYGLACKNDNRTIDRLYLIKGRMPEKRIARLISDADQIEIENPLLQTLAAKHWPGPLTLVVGEIAYRVPDHDFARELIRSFGEPLPTSSANRSGKPDSLTAESALLAVPDADLVLDGGSTSGHLPSTVVGVEGDKLVIFREGALCRAGLLADVGL